MHILDPRLAIIIGMVGMIVLLIYYIPVDACSHTSSAELYTVVVCAHCCG